MSNEDPNNSFHWRNKLEELEHVQGGSFNKNSAWNKLHERMQGKKSNRKLPWYWIAAACLFFVLIITLVNYYQRTSVLTPSETAEKKPAKINTPVPGVVENKKAGEINTGSTIKNKIAVGNKKLNYPDHRNIRTEIIANIQLNDTPGIHLETEPLAKTLQIPIVMSLPEKKKLTVVHINELGDPVIENTDIARKIDKRFSKLKLANEEVYASPTVVYKNTDFTLKAKL